MESFFVFCNCLGLCINFSKSELYLTQYLCFFFRTVLDIVDMSLSVPSDKFLEIQPLAHAVLQTQQVTVCPVMSFLVQD